MKCIELSVGKGRILVLNAKLWNTAPAHDPGEPRSFYTEWKPN